VLSQLCDYLDSQRNRIIRWQREMTGRPAIGPENNGTGENEKAAWLEAELAHMGLSEIRRYPCPDMRVSAGFRPNISARVPGGRKRTLWIIGHMDIVPPGDLALWHSPPYELRVDGDLLFGRGVEDNQQAIVTAMLAADALIHNGVTPELSLGLLFVADEETGMKFGLPHVLESAPDLIAEDDGILVPDMGNSSGSMVEIAEKSCLWLRLSVTGKQCHASIPNEGVNSLVAASACVLELERLHRLFRNKNALFTPSWSTFVPSKKEANVENINTLPGRDVFYLDCRVLPEYDLDDVEREIRAIASEVGACYKADIDVDIVHSERAPEATPADAPVVRSLAAALKKMRCIDARLCGVGGQTVAACLRRKKLQTAVWATLVPNAHSPNECSRISAAIADAKVILSMLFSPLG
jgi:succinyl-diaminopimelate desuccinylase